MLVLLISDAWDDTCGNLDGFPLSELEEFRWRLLELFLPFDDSSTWFTTDVALAAAAATFLPAAGWASWTALAGVDVVDGMLEEVACLLLFGIDDADED